MKSKHPPMAAGQRYGRLVVLGRVGVNSRRQTIWSFQCDCGKRHVAGADKVRNGKTRSCGCFHTELRRIALLKHGMTKTPEHRIWCGIRKRCNNPRYSEFYLYGGRGISVCERWLKFENFYDDMGPRPSVKHSIDRVDNEKNYEPSNCRWATLIEQANNKRRNIFVTYCGSRMTLSSFVRETGANYGQIRHHVSSGKTADEALVASMRSWPCLPAI